MGTMTRPRCEVWVNPADYQSRRCSRYARHRVPRDHYVKPKGPVLVCAQHARALIESRALGAAREAVPHSDCSHTWELEVEPTGKERTPWHSGLRVRYTCGNCGKAVTHGVRAEPTWEAIRFDETVARNQFETDWVVRELFETAL